MYGLIDPLVSEVACMAKKTVLIIDDSVNLAAALNDQLHLMQYATIVAHTGEEGLARALHMPDIDGFEVVRRLRKDPWGKTAHVLIMTASGGLGYIPVDLKFDPNDYLLKTGFGLEDIVKKIEEKISAPQRMSTQ
jgi:CheY-like chemotaxis protein